MQYDCGLHMYQAIVHANSMDMTLNLKVCNTDMTGLDISDDRKLCPSNWDLRLPSLGDVD